MDTLIIKAIEEGREGLRRLLGNKQIQELAKAYSLNEEAKSRIRGLHFQEAHPFFMIKEDLIISHNSTSFLEDSPVRLLV